MTLTTSNAANQLTTVEQAITKTNQQRMKPTPEAFERAVAFRHNPYGQGSLLFYLPETKPVVTGEVARTVPEGTLHTALRGRCSFVPYPEEEFSLPDDARYPEQDEPLVRVFMGQLPYSVTEMQLAWLCYTFGGHHVIGSTQRIVKRQPRGAEGVERLPTGCIHALCSASAVDEMAHGMHKRLLVDDTGVWYAADEAQNAALKKYVAAMKKDRRKRIAGRPYDSVVVQRAESDFVPAQPVWINDQASQLSEQAPPAYADARLALMPPCDAPQYPEYGQAPAPMYDDGMDTWRC